jgi:hypothetical protein
MKKEAQTHLLFQPAVWNTKYKNGSGSIPDESIVSGGIAETSMVLPLFAFDFFWKLN